MNASNALNLGFVILIWQWCGVLGVGVVGGCCVFWPAFRCRTHLKAGWNIVLFFKFLKHRFFNIFNVLSWFQAKNSWNFLKLRKKVENSSKKYPKAGQNTQQVVLSEWRFSRLSPFVIRQGPTISELVLLRNKNKEKGGLFLLWGWWVMVVGVVIEVV